MTLASHRQLTGSVVIATHNPGKLSEMRELLAPYAIAVQSAGELKLAEPEETGTTFAANARIKAMAASASSFSTLAPISQLQRTGVALRSTAMSAASRAQVAAASSIIKATGIPSTTPVSANLTAT